MMMRCGLVTAAAVLWACGAGFAQLNNAGVDQTTQDEMRQSFLAQNVGARLPAGAGFVDDQGRVVRLGNYLGKTPVLLVLGYFTCPDLCPLVFAHLTEELNGVAPVPGRDFQVVVISFDPNDTTKRAAAEKRACLKSYKYPNSGAAWHFLTGPPSSIAAVTKAVGFHYTYDRRLNEYVHPTGVMLVSPRGVLTHYFLGIDASPAEMESGIHDAAQGVQTTVDQPEQEYCINAEATLTPAAQRVNHIIQAGCIAWVVGLFGYIGFKIRGDVRAGRRGQKRQAEGVES